MSAEPEEGITKPKPERRKGAKPRGRLPGPKPAGAKGFSGGPADLEQRDSRPFDPVPDAETAAWLAALSSAVRAGHHVVRLGEGARDDDDPIVYCERDGRWWCGRYVGSITYAGRRLTILPRFELPDFERLLASVLGLVLVDSPGTIRESEAFVVRILAFIWTRGLLDAARHGLPVFRQDLEHVGTVVRGRLDVRGTVRHRQSGRGSGIAEMVSVDRERSLRNPAVKALVAGYAALRRSPALATTESQWLPARAKDLVARMTAAVPLGAGLPNEGELAQVRYTPINARFRPLVRLSMQIAQHRGLLSDAADAGAATGVLIDVAEVWELYVLDCLRAAFPDAEVIHGTHEATTAHLLQSEVTGRPLGLLKPDALVRWPKRTLVADAKYKFLGRTHYRPQGVDREDLYQIAAYASRFARDGDALLVYPQADDTAELLTSSPWALPGGARVHFCGLPIERDLAVPLLRGLRLR